MRQPQPPTGLGWSPARHSSYTSTEKNVKFLAVDNFRQRGVGFWKRPSMRHFMDPERDEKVENRAKKVEIFEVARVIVPKIV